VTRPCGQTGAGWRDATGGPDAISQAFSLTDASAPHDSGFVRPGTFAITQGAIPADWDFTGATCSDGSPVSAVAVSYGETVTCTFRHTKRGKITVIKDARPNDPQDFTFSIWGPSFAQSFPLDDDADPTLRIPARSPSCRGPRLEATPARCGTTRASPARLAELAERSVSLRRAARRSTSGPVRP
jgi:hypothetical protein